MRQYHLSMRIWINGEIIELAYHVKIKKKGIIFIAKYVWIKPDGELIISDVKSTSKIFYTFKYGIIGNIQNI